jgi:NAD(P)-dependent dehydrogenase (short-subunit alcohol dehydrogenase family)
MSAPVFRALVTGAAGGMGQAICFTLLEQARARGQQLHIAAASQPGTALERLVAQLQAAGAHACGLHANLAEPDQCQRLVDQALAFCAGGLDTLISNAGITRPGPLESLDVRDWDLVFNIDTRATWLLARAARAALAHSGGSIVAVASMSGSFPHPGYGGYSAAKAGLIMLCRQLAQEWGADGIRVNTVSPGMIRTPLTEPLYHEPEVAQRRTQMVPARRIGTPQDIARAVCHLAGPEAGYTSGIDLRVDGGLCDSLLATIPGRARS